MSELIPISFSLGTRSEPQCATPSTSHDVDLAPFLSYASSWPSLQLEISLPTPDLLEALPPTRDLTPHTRFEHSQLSANTKNGFLAAPPSFSSFAIVLFFPTALTIATKSLTPSISTKLLRSVVLRRSPYVLIVSSNVSSCGARLSCGALRTGQTLRNTLGFPIHRVFVSPFLRCVQTASQVVTALCAVHEYDDPNALSSHATPIDPSKVKVSVEYGLSEMMNRKGIRAEVAPKDGNFSIDISQREAMLPAGTVDDKVERLYKELPKWEEPVLKTRARYEQLFKDLADKYPTQNLLLVTHGEGVRVAISAFIKEAQVCDIEYCAYVELRRPIFQKDHSFTAGDFKVLTPAGQSGITYANVL